MVNREEQTKILIDGPGFVARKNRDYRPGEYRRLSNVELDNRRLRGRNNILSSYVDTTVEDYSFFGIDSTPQGAIGIYGQWTIYCDDLRQYAFSSSGGRIRMFNLDGMPEVLVTKDNFTSNLLKVVSFFEYNSKVYWLTIRSFGDIYLYYSLVWCNSSSDKNPSNLGTSSNPLTTVSPVTAENTISLDNSNNLFAGFKYNNSLISKERLWICNSEIVYFSKPTDLTKFDVADGGGFFLFNEDNVNYLLDGGDLLYVICEHSIYTIAYNTDPNVDAVVRKITDKVGGKHGCIFRDTPYFINTLGIYSINNNNVTYLMNSNLDEGINDFTSQKLTAYDRYIIINKTYRKSLLGQLFPNYIHYLDQVSWMPKEILSGNNLGYNTYALNMDTGSMHVIDFKPYYDPSADSFSGYIYDVFYNPNVDPLTGITSLMFATSNLYDDTFQSNFAGKAHVFFTGPNTNDIQDTVIIEGTSNTSRPIKPRYEIEVDAFTPDATEYVIKKFRSLEIMGTFPKEEFEIELAYNDQNYIQTTELIDVKDSLPNSRAHFPHRIGLNQRGQSIAIRMKSTNLNKIQDAGVPNTYDYLEISDMNMLWTYTQRSQKYASYSNKV